MSTFLLDAARTPGGRRAPDGCAPSCHLTRPPMRQQAQCPADECADMDALQSILGSELRADVLAALYLDEPRQWRLSEVGRAVDRPPQNISRELDWLVQVGVLTVAVRDEKRAYAIDTKSPFARELGQLVRQGRGPIPALRKALERLDVPVIAWLARAPLPVPRDAATPRSDLFVLTS